MSAPTTAATRTPSRDAPPERDEDQRVFLCGARFEDYETILAIRGERSVPRIAYLDGDIELLIPSSDHEQIKTTLARLLETWALEVGPDLTGYGSWTLERKKGKAGAEPDECYIVGPRPERKNRPDLAVEVVWTHGGLDKLEIYRRLRVAEVWIWEDGVITVRRLGDAGYEPVGRSVALPDLDLAWLAGFLERGSQIEAVRALRDEVRARRTAGG